MYYGRLSPEIARELRVLRDWIDRTNVPPSILDETLNVAKSSLEDFQRFDIKVQKAHLQTILKAAHVLWDRKSRWSLGDRGPMWKVTTLIGY